jgi:hypothetical protein
VVETGGLENHCTGNRTGGSNPSPSAIPTQVLRLRSGFRRAARFLACPEKTSGAKLPNGPRKRLKFESLSLRHYFCNFLLTSRPKTSRHKLKTI